MITKKIKVVIEISVGARSVCEEKGGGRREEDGDGWHNAHAHMSE